MKTLRKAGAGADCSGEQSLRRGISGTLPASFICIFPPVHYRIAVATAALGLLLGACASTAVTAKPCSQYCNTQQEGYEWAQRAVLLDEKACAGYAPEFVRGCKESVRDYQQAKSPREGW